MTIPAQVPARRRRARSLSALAVAIALIAAACSDDTADDTTDPGPNGDETAQGQPTDEAPIDFAASSGIDGQDPEFNLSALVWQGYWLSRDHFGPFVMASGAGVPFEPPMDAMQGAMERVAQNPDDPVRVPDNLLPLRAVYASAEPTLLNDPREFDPLDFEGLRLDPETFDETIRVRAQAETMLKESQWAHNFADPHFGAVDGEFGAQQRFMGQMVALLSIMQGRYAMENLATEGGLYADSDGTIDHLGNWVLLHTFADIAYLTGGEPAGGRYENPDVAPMFATATADLSDALADRSPETPEEAAAAVRALAHVAATDDGLAEGALGRIGTLAERVEELAPTTPAEHGAAIAALIGAGAALDDADYLDAADGQLQALAEDFDSSTGVFDGVATYTVDEVAWVIAGLNSALQQGVEDTRPEAARMLVAFYEATLSLGGMQLSAPPGKDGAMAGEFEKDLPHVNYYHPIDTPAPPMSGFLPVPAEEITLSDEGWEVTSTRFDVGGAMHLANELNWLGPHLGSIPFPLSEPATIPADQAEDAGDGDAQPSDDADVDGSTEVTVNAEDIEFDIERIEAEAGDPLTITFHNNDEDIPHNLHVQAGTVDAQTEITPGPDTQSLEVTIDEPGTYTFVCDVHPNMEGEIVVS